MKKYFLLLITIWFVFISNAQPPQKINYQTVVRDHSGQPLSSGVTVSFQFLIHDNSATGTTVYTENATLVTVIGGLVSCQIGDAGNLVAVNWANGDKYLEVLVDITGGTNYVSMGIAQLLSVPYALYAGNTQPGPPGVTGPTGPKGATGPTGATGVNIDTIINNGDGTMTVRLSNGVRTTVNLPTVGSTGPTGATGANGEGVDTTGNVVLPGNHAYAVSAFADANITLGDAVVVSANSDNAVYFAPFNALNVVGVALNTAPRGFLVNFAVSGVVKVNTDGPVTRGHFASVSSTMAGHATDVGTSNITGCFGTFFSSSSVAGQAWLLLFP